MVLPVSMDATWLDGSVSFNAQELRRADAALFNGEGSQPLGVYGGIVRHSDSSLLVTVNASDVITVQPGAVVIPGNAGVANGVYRTALAAADTGTLAARNATNPRIDLVVFRALDTSVVAGHGAYTGRVEVITGTPAASPVVPTLPTLAIELARVTVPATAGGTASVDLTRRTFASALGGVLPVATAAMLPSTPNAKWMQAVAIDTGTRYFWNGTSWLREGSWVTWGVSFPNLPMSSTQYAKYTIIGSTAHLRVASTVGGAAGPFWMDLPFTLATPVTYIDGMVVGISAGSGYTVGVVKYRSPTTVDFASVYPATNSWAATIPFTWKNTDQILVNLTAEIA